MFNTIKSVYLNLSKKQKNILWVIVGLLGFYLIGQISQAEKEKEQYEETLAKRKELENNRRLDNKKRGELIDSLSVAMQSKNWGLAVNLSDEIIKIEPHFISSDSVTMLKTQNEDLKRNYAMHLHGSGQDSACVVFLQNLNYAWKDSVLNIVDPELRKFVRYISYSKCCDGRTSSSTGRGACSGHGGVCGTYQKAVYETYHKWR